MKQHQNLFRWDEGKVLLNALSSISGKPEMRKQEVQEVLHGLTGNVFFKALRMYELSMPF